MSRRCHRWLVVHADNDPSSLLALARDRVVEELEDAGAAVALLDLHALGFDPVMSADEHARYFGIATDHPDPLVARSIDELRRADGVIFVFPTVWPALPSLLKGWFDRVLLPDVAFTLHPRTQRVTPSLRHIHRLVGITTSTAPTWRIRVDGDGARTTIGRALRLVCSRRTRVTWLALGHADRADRATSAAFLDRVATTVRGLP